MINHHATLKILSAELEVMLRGMRFSSAFTFRKSELILEFGGRERNTLFFNAVKGNSYLYALSGNFKPKKKQTVRLFSELEGVKLNSHQISEDESEITFQLEKGLKLKFVFYGSQPNALILNADSEILDSFKKPSKLKGVLYYDAFQSNKIHNVDSLSKLKQSLKSEPSVKLKKALRNSLPLVNKTIADELVFLAGLQPGIMSHVLSDKNFRELWKAHISISSAFSKPKLLLYDSSPPIFSLIELKHLHGVSSETFNSINDAVFETTKAVNAYEILIKKKREALKELKSRLESVSGRTKKTESRSLKTKRPERLE